MRFYKVIYIAYHTYDHPLLFSPGESIPIRLFLSGYELTPTMRDINKKFSVRYYLNLVLVDEEERRYFKQQVRVFDNLESGKVEVISQGSS